MAAIFLGQCSVGGDEFDWSFARFIAPVVATTSNVLHHPLLH